jgi:CHAT domain-containing protein/tetratricopeptide (TPR) repeat protein
MKPACLVASALFLLAIPIGIAPFALCPAWGEAASKAAPNFNEEIVALRTTGEYEAALDLAVEERSRIRADGDTLSVEFADLERLVATLRHIVALPDSSRMAMARADSLVDAYEALHRDARYDEALAAAQEALEIQTTCLGMDHQEVGASMSRVGFAMQNRGDLEAAGPVYEQALSIQRAALGESHPDIAQTLDWMGVMYLRQNKYEESNQALNESLEMYRQFTDASEGLAKTLSDRAHLLTSRGEHKAAEAGYLVTIKMWRKIGEDDSPGYATALDNLGVVYATQARYSEADQLCRVALAIRREKLHRDHPDVAVSLNNLGGLKFMQGDYAAAAPLFREALAIKRRTLPAGHQSVILGMINLGGILYKQGELEEAIALLEEALETSRNNLPPNHRYRGLALNNLGNVTFENGDYAWAESLQMEALSIYRSAVTEKHESVATVLNNIARTKIERGDYLGAEAYFRDALDIYEHQFGDYHTSAANSLINLSAMLVRQGRYTEAASELRRALSICDTLLLGSSPNAVTAMSLLGSVYIRRGEVDDAIGVLETACDAFEVARRRVSVGGLGRASYTASESPYRRLAVAYLARGDNDSAWEAVEKDNGRSLLDLLEIRSTRRLTEEEMAEEKRLDRELGNLEGAYIALVRDSTEAGSVKADSIRTVLLETHSRWSRYQKQLADKYPIAEGQAYSLKKIQSILDEDCAIVGWLDAEGSHFVYVVPHEGAVIWEELPAVAIDSLAQLYATSLKVGPDGGGDPRSLGQDVYAARLQPVEQHLKKVKRIFVVPTGPMLGVPVEALPIDREHYLVDTWDVGYAPSATILTWLQQKPKPKGEPSLFALGDPPFSEEQALEMAGTMGGESVAVGASASERRGRSDDREVIASLNRLSGSRKEATDIAALFETSEVLLGEDASEANLVAGATEGRYEQFRCIHFATHALIDDRRPERSCLVLSQVGLPDPLETVIAGGRIVDGRLIMDEVLREWRLDADLVTLSACETALGRELRGEGYIGFAHAFFHAGTRSVVVSLWKVDDRATRRLMVRFYENMIERDMTRSAALRDAKRWLRDHEGRGGVRPFSHPAFWSGFILLGDPN